MEEQKQRRELEARNETEKREHEKWLKYLQNRPLEDAIRQCKNEILKFDQRITKLQHDINKIIEEKIDAKQDLDTIEHKTKSFLGFKLLTLQKFDTEIGLSEYSQKLEMLNDEIKAAIDKTNVDKDFIDELFLSTESLIDANIVHREFQTLS